MIGALPGSSRLLAAPAPDPDRARELLARELSGARYQESLPERFSRWVQEALDRLGDVAASSGSLGVLAGVVITVVLVVLLGFALSRLRPGGGRERTGAEVFAAPRRTAAEHRAAALAALADARHDDCVLESVRALTAQLVERDLLRDTVGLTVLEVSTSAARRFPEEAEALQRLRVAFEDLRYGDRHADEAIARDAVATEERVQRAAPGSGSTPSLPAVPS